MPCWKCSRQCRCSHHSIALQAIVSIINKSLHTAVRPCWLMVHPIIPGTKRVETLWVLGVTLNSRLAIGDHIDRIITTCASSRFTLRTLRSHGLRQVELHLVARMTSIAFLPGGASPMLLRGLGSTGCWRVSGEPGTFRLTFLHSRNLHIRQMMACSGQFPPTQTMFSDTYFKDKRTYWIESAVSCSQLCSSLQRLSKQTCPGQITEFCFSAAYLQVHTHTLTHTARYIIFLCSWINCKLQLTAVILLIFI